MENTYNNIYWIHPFTSLPKLNQPKPRSAVPPMKPVTTSELLLGVSFISSSNCRKFTKIGLL